MNFLKIIFFFIILQSFVSTARAQLLKAKNIYTKADSLRGELTPLRTCYDIKYYFLDVEVDIDNRFISGTNLFLFEATQDFDRLQFDLFDNLSIDEIEYHGQMLSFQREYNAVFVDFPDVIEKGKLDSFTVKYSGHPITATRAPWDGGFDWKKDSNGKHWVATACQGLGASAWWPNKDHQSDEVDSMLLAVTVPRDLMNVSNGRLVKTEQPTIDTKKYYWKIHYPINNYNVALNIGDYEHFHEEYVGEQGKLDLDFYVLKENIGKISHLQQNVHSTLQAFEYWFGPYPFYKDGYKIVETAHLGMEHQSAIAYGNKYQNGYLGKDNSGTGWGLDWDFIIVHETGHEWFGNNITAKDLADMWIHESFTNYSESLFIDYFYGKEAGQEYLYGNRSGILNDSPLQGPFSVNQSGSGDMYLKGGVFHNMVRTIIEDDEKWRSILRSLNETFNLQTVDYDDIVNFMSEKSEMDLTKIFEQYIKHAGIPTLEIAFMEDGNTYARWKADVENFHMPIHLGIAGQEMETVDLSASFKQIKIPGLDRENIEIDTYNYYIQVSFL